MRHIPKVILTVAAVILATATPSFAQTPLYFVVDPDTPNELQAYTSYEYFDPDTFGFESDSEESDVETDSAAADPSVTNEFVVDSVVASTAMDGYETPSLSWSGEGIMAATTAETYTNEVTAILGLDAESGTPTQMIVAGIIASDVYEEGTACTFSGEITLTWDLTGDVDHLTGRSALITVLVNGSAVASMSLGASYSGGTGHLSNDIWPITVDPANDSLDLTFSVTAHVGDHIVITALSAASVNNQGPDGHTDSDSQAFTIDVGLD